MKIKVKITLKSNYDKIKINPSRFIWWQQALQKIYDFVWSDMEDFKEYIE